MTSHQVCFCKHADFEKNKQQLIRVQVANEPSAPLNIATPFCENRYHKIAALAERCCFIWRKTTRFRGFCADNEKICILPKKEPALLARIRGPPSEI